MKCIRNCKITAMQGNVRYEMKGNIVTCMMEEEPRERERERERERDVKVSPHASKDPPVTAVTPTTAASHQSAGRGAEGGGRVCESSVRTVTRQDRKQILDNGTFSVSTVRGHQYAVNSHNTSTSQLHVRVQQVTSHQ